MHCKMEPIVYCGYTVFDGQYYFMNIWKFKKDLETLELTSQLYS